jgi:hypothetical protein
MLVHGNYVPTICFTRRNLSPLDVWLEKNPEITDEIMCDDLLRKDFEN